MQKNIKLFEKKVKATYKKPFRSNQHLSKKKLNKTH